MQITIDRVMNGYVLSYQGDQWIFPETKEGLVDLLDFLVSEFDGHGSRYDKERIYINIKPGDKYEGDE